MKKQITGFLAGIIAAALIMCVAFPSVAATIEAAFNSVNIMVNGARQADIGESLRLADGREVPYSINYNGTVYLPLRKLAELIGMEVAWDAGTSTAALYDGRERALLDIPTYDGNPSTGHPSVVHVPGGGWNGYKYWMADTPYPAESRENPSVFASNDGVNWVVPNGAPNPVVPLSEIQADGYGHSSDTNLVMLPDNTLALYYRVVGGVEVIYRKTSSDGKTWDNKHRCFKVLGSGSDVLSPAVVIVGGTYYMYAVNASTGPYKITRRTSKDGLNWSEPVDCTQPLNRAWHIDVCYAGGKYRMLAATHAEWNIYYLESEDGLNWTQPYDGPAIKRSGEEYDINGYYKAAMIPRPGQKLLFDVWVTSMSSFESVNVYDNSCVWRTLYLKNVDLEKGPN
ncbi:MAG: hypothetical protein GX541_03110 [Clostridiales bacterium]|jgi:hypothetical protein|nr:hypothetical protein [Clostridiales bacterium]